VILELSPRKIVGWSLQATMNANLDTETSVMGLTVDARLPVFPTTLIASADTQVQPTGRNWENTK
jgi:hypothetical protein